MTPITAIPNGARLAPRYGPRHDNSKPASPAKPTNSVMVTRMVVITEVMIGMMPVVLKVLVLMVLDLIRLVIVLVLVFLVMVVTPPGVIRFLVCVIEVVFLLQVAGRKLSMLYVPARVTLSRMVVLCCMFC